MKKILVGILCLVLLTSIVGVVMAVGTTASVTVNQFLSVTLTSGSPVAFGSMNPGATEAATNDPLVATIGSESNVDADVKTKADDTNFVCVSGLCTVDVDNFAVSNMEWENSLVSPTWTDYTTSDATVCSSVVASGTCDIYHQLTIPSSTQAAGTYSTGITITATAA